MLLKRTDTDDATGRRRPSASRVRGFIHKQILRVEYRLGRADVPVNVKLTPTPRTAADTADLAGRLNWFLPKTNRKVSIIAPRAPRAIRAGDAPYLDSEVVDDPGWISSADSPAGRTHLLVHKLTPASVLSMVLKPRDFTFIDPRFAFGSDEEFYRLTKRFCRFASPTAIESFDRIARHAVEGGRALVLATGPSAELIDPAEFSADIRFTCNSAVRDHSLLSEMNPNLIAFSDPVFHSGPSRYAAQFRKDLRYALDSTEATFVTSSSFVAPLLIAMPEIVDRLAVFDLESGGAWRWPVSPGDSLRTTGNVLTNLMLPIAFATSSHVRIAGCDGRDPDEKYFWKHNAARQYDDELMQSAFDTHPGFFKYRIYADYYARHCTELEELITQGEESGRSVTSVTPSHIPALKRRARTASSDR